MRKCISCYDYTGATICTKPQENSGLLVMNFDTTRKIVTNYTTIYHYFCTFAPHNIHHRMDNNELYSNYQTVCAAPSGNGFRVEHMPDSLLHSEIDDSSPHVHSFYEILWFWEGEGWHNVDFVDYEVRPNTIFFLSPGQTHNFDHNVDKAQGLCRYTGVAIKMCIDLMGDEDGGQNAMLKYNAFHTFDTAPYYNIDESTAARLHLLVQMMEEESLRAREFGNTDVLKSLLRIFLVMIQRHGQREDTLRLDSLKPSHQLFVQFRRLVNQEFRHLHTVQEYADRLNVAVRTLNKCVNECSNESPLSFVNHRITLEAKRLIRYTSMKVKEISYELGYDDPSYFVKFFKRQTGYIPSDFREMEVSTTSHAMPPRITP